MGLPPGVSRVESEKDHCSSNHATPKYDDWMHSAFGGRLLMHENALVAPLYRLLALLSRVGSDAGMGTLRVGIVWMNQISRNIWLIYGTLAGLYSSPASTAGIGRD